MNLSQLKNIVANKLSPTAKLKFFGLVQIPLLFAVNPRVLKIDDEACEVLIPLNYVTQNHLKSMYFGALAIGADAVVAIHALSIAEQFKNEASIVPVFKDLKVDFLKRAESNVVFRCEQGQKIRLMIKEAIEKKERVTSGIEVVAFAENDINTIYARFILGLSLKAKK